MFKKIGNFLLSFFELQLFVSLISWPLLLAWGLPLSWATPIGNLLFNPLLSAFIFVSSLCMFTELLSIPNEALIWLLEQLTNLWLWCLSWGHDSFLLSFPKPPFLLLIGIVLCALATIFMVQRKIVRITLFGSFFILFGILAHCIQENKSFSHVLQYRGKNIMLFTYKKQATLLVSEALCSTKNLDQWVQYTLKPLLIKTTGKASLDTLNIYTPKAQKWAAELQKQVPCSAVYHASNRLTSVL
jgi:hypothetical protein